MNKNTFTILILIVIYGLSVLTYKTIYPNYLQPVSIIETPATESSDSAESATPSTDSEDVNLAIKDGQATGADQPTADNPAAENPKIVADSPKIQAPKTANTPIVVSRGAETTDTYKYPNISKVNGSFGQFRYRDLSGGRIEIDPQWIANNIVTITLPGLNQRVQVNKAAAANFIKAFTLIKNGTATINGRQVSLLSLIKTMDGTFVTRHVNWGGPTTGLSNHSWGTAIDINASNHYVGLRIDPNSTTDPNAILWREAFQPAGFSWGNRYNTGPDSMHYELLK